MPWKECNPMSERFDFCHSAQPPGTNLSALCQKFEISRSTGYKWLRRYIQEGDAGLADRSRRPHHSPTRTPAEMEAQVLDLRRQYPCWGPRKIRAVLLDRLSPERVPAVVTVARILTRCGLTRAQPPTPDWGALKRFVAPEPNHLWQMDLKAPLRLPDRRKLYPVGLLDDHSRFLLGLWLLPDQTEDSVIACWIKAAQHYGLPQYTLTDHGPQFRNLDEDTSAFRVYLWACGVGHTQGRIGHPQTQGKIERFWRTLHTEVLSRHCYADPMSWQRCLDDWRKHYNEVRPHQELGDEPPSRHYCPSVRPYVAPDRHHCVGQPDSVYRWVNPRGQISLNGQRLLVGRGLSGWMVENRPQGNGCWQAYFYHHFVREFLLTDRQYRKEQPQSSEISGDLYNVA